jgi:hypothetical protein
MSGAQFEYERVSTVFIGLALQSRGDTLLIDISADMLDRIGGGSGHVA